MSPVTSLVLLLAFSCGSPSIAADTEEKLPIFEKPGTCPLDVDFPRCDNPGISYPPECITDENCEGEGKCCLSGCRKRCRLPLQDKTDSCPYFDNSICVHVKPGPPECRTDDQCQGTERCCFNNCQLRCTPTVKEKPGTCPLDVDFPWCDNPAIFYPPECITDENCEGEGKCCLSGCRKRCRLPLQDKTDSCPYFDNSICVHDKPGPPECHTDDQCQGTERCCFNNCQLRCTPTVKEKPGSCPFPIMLCKRPILPTLCTSDQECPGSQKCCAPECQQKCMDPFVVEKHGSCPIPNRLCKRSILPPSCTSDQHCPGSQKCCAPECHQKCMDPFVDM